MKFILLYTILITLNTLAELASDFPVFNPNYITTSNRYRVQGFVNAIADSQVPCSSNTREEITTENNLLTVRNCFRIDANGNFILDSAGNKILNGIQVKKNIQGGQVRFVFYYYDGIRKGAGYTFSTTGSLLSILSYSGLSNQANAISYDTYGRPTFDSLIFNTYYGATFRSAQYLQPPAGAGWTPNGVAVRLFYTIQRGFNSACEFEQTYSQPVEGVINYQLLTHSKSCWTTR